MIRTRLQLLALLLVLPFAAIAGQLAHMQLFEQNHKEYTELAERRRAVYSVPKRGSIVTNDGTVLAANRTVFDLYFLYHKLNPRELALRRLVSTLEGHGLQFSLKEVEQSLLWAAQQSLGEKSPWDGGAAWFPLLHDLGAEVAQALEQRLRTSTLLTLAAEEDNAKTTLYFHRERMLTFERTLSSVATLLAQEQTGQTTPMAADLEQVVDRTLARIARLARGEALALKRAGKKEKLVRAKEVYARDAHLRNPWLLERDVPQSVVTEIEYYPERYPGVVVQERTERFYPQAEVFGTLTGYVQTLKDPRTIAERGRLLEKLSSVPTRDEFLAMRAELRSLRMLEGAAGLESSREAELRGLPGQRITRNLGSGRTASAQDVVPVEQGRNVETTLDAALQARLYEELSRRIAPLATDAPGVAGSAVVLDVATGAVLALVGFPGVDPNRVREPGYSFPHPSEAGKPAAERTPTELKRRYPGARGVLLDRPSRHPLYPGSLFKVVVAAAAMEEGQPWEGEYTPTRVYECLHRFALNQKLRCSAEYGHTPTREVDLPQALQFSCNNYFYYLGLKHLDAEALLHWARAFGLGQRTGVDLHAERLRVEAGELSPPEKINDVGRCYLSIGQVHVRTTPLQVARMFAAIGGEEPRLPIPYLIEPSASEAPPVPISAGTRAAIRDGLWRAAHHAGGTASHARLGLREFPVALKTGTAEVDRKDRVVNLAWLAGYAPAVPPESGESQQARIAFAVVIEETTGHGGDACAPVVRALLEHFTASNPAVFGPDALSGSASAR